MVDREMIYRKKDVTLIQFGSRATRTRISGIILFLELVLLFAIRVDGDIECSNLTAPPEIICGCHAGCDKEGACLRAKAPCTSYRFGPRCIYAEMAGGSSLQSDPHQELSWVKDHDDRTCNRDPGLQLITMTLVSEIYVSWIWLYVKDESETGRIAVTTKTAAGIEKICNAGVAKFDSHIIEIHCHHYDTLSKGLVFMGNALRDLCEIHVNGGKEISRNRKATQVNTYNHGLPGLAVDGNINMDFNSGGCSSTAGTLTPTNWWEVEFDTQSFIYSIFIIARDSFQFRNLRHQVFLRHFGMRDIRYPFPRECNHYRITKIPAKSDFGELRIEQYADTGGDSTLTLCEVVVFGESHCSPNKHGQKCDQDCHCLIRTKCVGNHGLCPDGCAPGWLGYDCQKACPYGKYGQDCKETCNKNCNFNRKNVGDSTCHHVTGDCVYGCMPGYQKDTNCEKECPSGTYGLDCNDTCSKYCNDDPNDVASATCHFATGDCYHGCMPGYQPETQCQKACHSGTYGQDCNETCTENCLVTPNNVADEICDHITGACLQGCMPGYQTHTHCSEECPNGKYGQDCRETCNKNCYVNPTGAPDAICDRITGDCLQGCMPGYQRDTECNKECPSGTFGQDCRETCNPNCLHEICDHITGTCLQGCKPGYQTASLCNQECPNGKYGQDCGGKCNKNCYDDPNNIADAVCDHRTGACLQGCRPGYQPANLCNKECPNGNYGQDCKETCNTNCYDNPNGTADVICDPISGTCLQGCIAGYQAQIHCKNECPPGTYGRNCAQKCSAECQYSADYAADSRCDHKTGECLHGCAIGYNPPTCHDKCPSGTYGQACTEKCNPNCYDDPDDVADSICHPITGDCTQGCMPGYQPADVCNKECPTGTYGRYCNETCSTNCKGYPDDIAEGICDFKTGDCFQGCKPGYRADAQCKKECPDDKYGPDCREPCNENCYVNQNGAGGAICDHLTGACLQGCMPGYLTNAVCNKECPAGTYGLKCAQTCSANCDISTSDVGDWICYPQTGECLHGCLMGYQPPNCDDICVPGTFGKNCMQNCSESCVDIADDTEKSTCDRTSGACFACPLDTYGETDCLQKCSENCAEIPENSALMSTCDQTTGACFGGCLLGYEPPTCHAACPVGTFGTDCRYKCNENCANLTCNHTTGACLSGCVSGYEPPDCETECPPGTFGANCLNNCSKNCAGVSEDSTFNSTCTPSTGACLGGCMSGYKPPTCDEAKPPAPSLADFTATYALPLVILAGLIPLCLLLCLLAFGFCGRNDANRETETEPEPETEPEQANDDNEVMPQLESSKSAGDHSHPEEAKRRDKSGQISTSV